MPKPTPLIKRPVSGRLIVEIPIDWNGAWGGMTGNEVRSWLWEALGDRTRSEFNRSTKRWEVAREHQRALLLALLQEYGSCRVVTDSYVSQSTQCDTRCVEAEGDDCVCSCGGMNHKGSADGYWQVGETTLVGRYGDIQRTERMYVRP